MCRLLQNFVFFLGLLLATTHGRHIPNSLNDSGALKLSADLTTINFPIGTIERRVWTSTSYGAGCSEYSRTASIEPQASYSPDTLTFANTLLPTTTTDASYPRVVCCTSEEDRNDKFATSLQSNFKSPLIHSL